MAKKKKAAESAKKREPVKRAYTRRSSLSTDPVKTTEDELIFEKEPPPLTRYNKPGLDAFLQKVKGVVGIINPGQAFIIPFEYRNSVKRYLTVTYPEQRFFLRNVLGNDKVMRVYCVPPIVKKKK